MASSRRLGGKQGFDVPFWSHYIIRHCRRKHRGYLPLLLHICDLCTFLTHLVSLIVLCFMEPVMGRSISTVIDWFVNNSMVLFWSWGLEKTLAGELSKHISFFFQEQVFSPAVKVLARMLVLHICMAGKLREREKERELCWFTSDSILPLWQSLQEVEEAQSICTIPSSPGASCLGLGSERTDVCWLRKSSQTFCYLLKASHLRVSAHKLSDGSDH